MAFSPVPGWSRRFRWAGLLLGLALGGFFDGILLHQVLQWHHLLSAVRAAPWGDLRMQLLADGLFHALMYLVMAAGLVLLVKARQELVRDGSGRCLLAWLLIGVGAWNVLDTFVFHWITGIHRIRMDAANPLLWDLAWLLVFGLGFGAAGEWLRRGAGGPGDPSARAAGAGASLALLVVVSSLLSARAPGAGGQEALVVFRPGISPAQAFNAIGQLGASVVWVDAAGAVWAVRLAQPGAARALYRRGALLVSDPAISLGCLSWSRPGAAPQAGLQQGGRK